MSSVLEAIVFDAQDLARVTHFWAAVLQREVIEDSRGTLLPGTDTQAGVRFSPGTMNTRDGRRLHLHLTSTSLDDQNHTVATALRLGARHIDVGQLPDEGHIVLTDPDGNEFCVIKPNSTFLAGCGFLGEVACDGTRQVGLFWSAALGWPLVWDHNDETAIQSPFGGTKIAWGGPPVAPKYGRNHQRFQLICVGHDTETEINRLIALGATLISSAANGDTELVDPDGNEFYLTRPQ